MQRATEADFYVSPSGNDAWSGTLPAPNAGKTDGPFASLVRARDGVRVKKEARGTGEITVLVRGGTYRLRETIVFGLEDSGHENQPITYAAFPDETPVFTSGVSLTDWQRLNRPPAGLPKSAHGKVWVADVSHIRELRDSQPPPVSITGLERRRWPFLTMYDGTRRLTRARSQGFSPVKAGRGGQDDRTKVTVPEGAIPPLAQPEVAELVIVPCHFWIANILPVQSIDPGEGQITTAAMSTYPMTKNGMVDRDSAWIENALEVLDTPGEWVVDPAAEKVYYWPESGTPSEEVVVPLLTVLFRVEGAISYDARQDRPVTHLTFRGLTFMHGERLPWAGGTGWGLQHDWECFDSPTALVRFRGAENCAIEECRFAHSSHTAIRLDLHCRHNRITGNHIEHIGGVGVLLAGYGPGTKDVNTTNEVSNNYIHNVGELGWAAVGIFAWQSGSNRIAHNHLHHMPYTGIVVSGRIGWDRSGRGECSRTVRWSDIETAIGKPLGKKRLSWQERERFLHGRKNLLLRNDIHNVMELLGDGNCIYVSGTGGGNVVRENICHHSYGKYMNAVIRCDDDQHGTLMEGNVCYQTSGHAEGFISKGDNDIVRNIVADMRPVARHRGYLVFPYGNVKGSRVQQNIFFSRLKGQTVCCEGKASKRRPNPPLLRHTDADSNVYFCTEDSEWGARHLAHQREHGIEGSSVSADPLFRGPDVGDFSMSPASPALGLGIPQPVSPSSVGLEEPYRSRFLGRRLNTRIVPAGGLLRDGHPVTLACDAAGAEIRYTVDGTTPDQHATFYEGPFNVKAPAVVRAKAFAQNGTDLFGAQAAFTAPPRPIIEDFEEVSVGEMTPNASTQEEDGVHTARVSAEGAVSGRHSLKFVDGPGQKYPFNPHVYYRMKVSKGQATGRFDLMIDENTSFYYQWRQYGNGGFCRGPTVQVSPGAKLMGEGLPETELHVGEWVRFEVTCRLGTAGPTTFTLRITPPNRAPVEIPGLPCDEQFRRLDWVGFVANGELATTFYIDDVQIDFENQ